MEKLMLATEEIFLDTTDTEHCMAAECAKLVEYLRRRSFQTGLIVLDADKTLDQSVQEALDVYLSDEQHLEEVLNQVNAECATKYFLDNSKERLEKMANYGFTPVYIDEQAEIDENLDCLAFPSVSEFHLSLIQANFEQAAAQ